jgi:hypothetical protein
VRAFVCTKDVLDNRRKRIYSACDRPLGVSYTVPTYKNKFFVFPSPFRLVCEKLVLNSISEKWNSKNFEFHFFSSESPEIETQEIG